MLTLVPLVNINVGGRCNTEWYEILMASVPTFIWSVVGIVLTPTPLEFNIFSSSVKLLSEGSDRFHILFTAHVHGELIGWCAIRLDSHNIVGLGFNCLYRYNIPHFSPFVQGKVAKKSLLS